MCMLYVTFQRGAGGKVPARSKLEHTEVATFSYTLVMVSVAVPPTKTMSPPPRCNGTKGEHTYCSSGRWKICGVGSRRKTHSVLALRREGARSVQWGAGGKVWEKAEGASSTHLSFVREHIAAVEIGHATRPDKDPGSILCQEGEHV